MEQLSDVELLALVAGHEEPALRALVDRHTAWLRLRLRRRTPDEELITEALQATFVAAWNGARSFRGDGDVGAWLWGIALRQLLSLLRKRAQPTPTLSDVLSALSPTMRSAEDELLVRVEYSALGDALDRLSPELHQVLRATVIDGLSTREAAQLLGIPQGTVKSRARLAKSKLREQLILLEARP